MSQNPDTALAVVESQPITPAPLPVSSPLDLPPEVFSAGLARRKANRQSLMAWIAEALKVDVDYGRIHTVGKDKCPNGKRCEIDWHWSKPTLYKPGAEKICGMLNLRATFPTAKDYEQAALNGTEIKTIVLRCELVDGAGNVVGSGMGARSLAKDYGDVNKALKMASKSAQIDATLRTGGLSEIFTQDLEDMDLHSEAEIDARQAAREAEAVKHTSYPVHEGYPQGVKGPRNAPGQAGGVSGQPPQSKGQPDAKAGQNPQSQPKIGQVTDKARIDHPKSQEDKIAAFEHWLSKEFGPQGIPWCEGYLHLHSIGGSDMNPALGLTADGVKETLKVLTAVDLDQIPKCGKTPKEGWTNFRQRLADFIEANADNHPDLVPASHSSDMAGPGQASNPVGSVSAGPAQTPSVAEQTSKEDRVNTPGAASHPLPDNCPNCQSPRLEYGVNYGHRVGVCGACEHHFLADLALDKAWRTFPVPFGKAAGVQLGEMPKNTLFGWAMNYQPEPYKGKVSEKDKKFRAMLDLAAAVYAFKEKGAE